MTGWFLACYQPVLLVVSCNHGNLLSSILYVALSYDVVCPVTGLTQAGNQPQVRPITSQQRQLPAGLNEIALKCWQLLPVHTVSTCA